MNGLVYNYEFPTADPSIDDYREAHKAYWITIAQFEMPLKPTVVVSNANCWGRRVLENNCFACGFAERQRELFGLGDRPTCLLCPIKGYGFSGHDGACCFRDTAYSNWVVDKDYKAALDVANLEWYSKKEYGANLEKLIVEVSKKGDDSNDHT